MDVTLTDREADLMQVLWDRGPSLVVEVQAALHDRLAYTTVLTVLRTLEAKGFVRHDTEGRGHRYGAAVPRARAQRSALRHLARKLFDGSADALVLHLVSDKKLSAAAIERLRTLLDDQEEAG